MADFTTTWTISIWTLTLTIRLIHWMRCWSRFGRIWRIRVQKRMCWMRKTWRDFYSFILILINLQEKFNGKTIDIFANPTDVHFSVDIEVTDLALGPIEIPDFKKHLLLADSFGFYPTTDNTVVISIGVNYVYEPVKLNWCFVLSGGDCIAWILFFYPCWRWILFR